MLEEMDGWFQENKGSVQLCLKAGINVDFSELSFQHNVSFERIVIWA